MIDSKAQIAEILDAVRDITELSIDKTGLGLADAPAFTLGPPSLAWEGYSDTPTSIEYTGVLYVLANDQSVDRLITLLPLVIAQVESVEDVTVTAAVPQIFRAGASDLPSYRLTIEVTQ